ncbi:MAG: DNA repair and recombination protein RadA, partial [Candidatus Bathyarchaeota archaeon]|nr:DNA repair and recombination protein RadA [Candidatus Bathyarchaeota archaeon]
MILPRKRVSEATEESASEATEESASEATEESASEATEEPKKKFESIDDLAGVGPATANKLIDLGYQTIESLATAA